MSEMQLPENWIVAPLEEVLTAIVGGGTPSKSNQSYYQGSLPWMTVKDMKSDVINDTIDHISQEAVENSATNIIPAGTPIVATRMSLGKIVTATQDIAINQDLKAIFPSSEVNTKYLIHWYRSLEALIESIGTGTTVKGIRLDDLKTLKFPLPSLAEQKQIADTVDRLLAQVVSSKAELEAALVCLKQFRQSVLAAAVNGELTRDWRKSEELTNWKMFKLANIVSAIEAGKNLKCIETPPKNNDEFGIVKISAVTWGFYDEEQSKTLPDKGLFIENKRIKDGDFLLSRANTLELLGSPVIVHKVTKNLMLSDKVLRLVMDENDKKWTSIFLRSFDGRKAIESRATGNQESMRNIGQKALLDIDIPKPPAAEQTEIVSQVEALFAAADEAEAETQTALDKVNSLTQSILAKAFSGELTEQWREQTLRDTPELLTGDNSAASLLVRIKAEREAKILADKEAKKAARAAVKKKVS